MIWTQELVKETPKNENGYNELVEAEIQMRQIAERINQVISMLDMRSGSSQM